MPLGGIIGSRKLDYLCYLGLLCLNQDCLLGLGYQLKCAQLQKTELKKWFKQCVN